MEKHRRPDRARLLIAERERSRHRHIRQRREQQLRIIVHDDILPDVVEREERDRRGIGPEAALRPDGAEDHAAKQALLHERRHEHRDGDHALVVHFGKAGHGVVVRHGQLADETRAELQHEREQHVDAVGGKHHADAAQDAADHRVKAAAQEPPHGDEREHEAAEVIQDVAHDVRRQLAEHRHEQCADRQRQHDRMDGKIHPPRDARAARHGVCPHRGGMLHVSPSLSAAAQRAGAWPRAA